ncbi:hypothetical protein niasHT_004219 [Heterodera trifolii]|uniref:arginine kinase n=1 Tax=Heterodera trifolii TaxID=157864 RepID=A0ABD2MG24_9BILA
MHVIALNYFSNGTARRKKKKHSSAAYHRPISSPAIDGKQQQTFGSFMTPFGKRRSVRVAIKMNSRILRKMSAEFSTSTANGKSFLDSSWVCNDIGWTFSRFLTMPNSASNWHFFRHVSMRWWTNITSGVGVYAPDAEAYTLFKPLLDPIIEASHDGFGPNSKQPATDFVMMALDRTASNRQRTLVSGRRNLDPIIEASHDGFGPNSKQPATDFGERKTQLLTDLDPEGKFIESTRIHAELGGTYYPIEGMANDVQNQLIADHLLFKEADLFLQHANAYCHWPTGLGIFHNAKKSFLVWVNDEDHIRIISMQNGGNVGQVLERLIKGVRAIESKATFLRDDRLGWLTFCPSNLGTAVRQVCLFDFQRSARTTTSSRAYQPAKRHPLSGADRYFNDRLTSRAFEPANASLASSHPSSPPWDAPHNLPSLFDDMNINSSGSSFGQGHQSVQPTTARPLNENVFAAFNRQPHILPQANGFGDPPRTYNSNSRSAALMKPLCATLIAQVQSTHSNPKECNSGDSKATQRFDGACADWKWKNKYFPWF